MTGRCQAWGCNARCKPGWLMCLSHWSMVPDELQAAYYAAHDERHSIDQPSRLLAEIRARIHVATIEGHTQPVRYWRALERGFLRALQQRHHGPTCAAPTPQEDKHVQTRQ